MALTTLAALNGSYYLQTANVAYSLQNSSLTPILVENRFADDNRLYRHLDGSLEVIPRTFCEIIGKQVIRPLLNSAYDWSNYPFDTLKNGFSFISRVSQRINLLPVVAAQQTKTVIQHDEKNIPLDCEPIKILSEAIEKSQNQPLTLASRAKLEKHKQKQPLTLTGSEEVTLNQQQIKNLKKTVSKPRTDFTEQEARDKIENAIGRKIPEIAKRCNRETEIAIIKNTKTPDLTEKRHVGLAYEQLQVLADNGELTQCKIELEELFDEIIKHCSEFHLDTLRPLPKLQLSLLQNTGTGYTSIEITNLVVKTNTLAIKFLRLLEKTNEEKTILQWFDVMLETAGKDDSHIIPSLQATERLLRSKIGENITEEQKLELRKIVDRYLEGPYTEVDKSIATKILTMTAPRTVGMRYVYPRLEHIPKDIKIFDNLFQRVGSALIEAQTSRFLVKSTLSVAAILVTIRISRYLFNNKITERQQQLLPDSQQPLVNQQEQLPPGGQEPLVNQQEQPPSDGQQPLVNQQEQPPSDGQQPLVNQQEQPPSDGQ